MDNLVLTPTRLKNHMLLIALPSRLGSLWRPAFCLALSHFFLASCLTFAQGPIVLTDVTEQSGIVFEHTDGSDGRHFIIESMSAGLAMLDFDLDGDLDLYFLNGAPLDRPAETKFPTNALYRNEGNMRFSDVTESAGVGDTGYGLGVACADFDNDGDPDIFVNNYGTNVLYVNNGDGTFINATRDAGTDLGELVGSGASFFDLDLDGDLDLYVGNYNQFDIQGHQVHFHKGLPSYPSPQLFEAEFDDLYRNNGDGTFTNIAEEAGVRSVSGRSMGIVAFDYDNDSDTDVLVANDTQANFLFENDGKGQFTEVGLLAGLAYDFRGQAQASMGLDVADFNRDGLPDVVMTSFAEEYTTIYYNLGQGLFEDATIRAGIGPATRPHVTWGVIAGDFDSDGWKDIFVACGDLDDNRARRGGALSATGYRVPNLVFRNLGRGKFEDLRDQWGSGATVSQSSRGAVAGDLDGDGDLDIAVLNARSRPTLLRNDTRSDSLQLAITLIGRSSNRNGIGAKIELVSGDEKTVEPVLSGRSYQGDVCGPIVIAADRTAEELRFQVTWPGHISPQEYVVQPNPIEQNVLRLEFIEN
jgi:hypothetical protein